MCAPAELVWLSRELGHAVGQVTLHEGKYHQVKKMFSRIGGHVIQLHRNAVGGLDLAALGVSPGEYRKATAVEMEAACAAFPATAAVRDLRAPTSLSELTAVPVTDAAAISAAMGEVAAE